MHHFFDDKAATWDQDPKKVERARIFAEGIRAAVQVDGRQTALDFGCGTGLLSFFLQDAFQHITLVDNSAGMIDVLSEKIKTQRIAHFSPVQCDVLNEPRPQLPTVDVIYTLMTLHHITDLEAIFSVFKSLLNKGGYLCIADLEKEDGSFHAGHPGFDGHNGFDKDELMSRLRAFGFDLVSYTTPFTLEKPGEHKTRFYPLFLMVVKSV